MRYLILFFAFALLAGCKWEVALPDDAAAIHVERGRELIVTDDAVLASLASLRFANVLERLPLRQPPAQALASFFDAWSARLREEGEVQRAARFDDLVARHLLDPGSFQLIAAVNRTDLSVMPDRAGEGGEARLVYALHDGDVALPFTMIVELAQDGPAAEWAKRWHALGTVADAPQAVGALFDGVLAARHLAQIRTADAVTGPLLMHEFHVVAGDLVASGVRDTPDWSLVTEADLTAFSVQNADAIAKGTHVLPPGWLARGAPLDPGPPAYVGTLAGHEALLAQTCGGCHQGSANGFQIDPLAAGDAKLSRFLVDPTKDLDEVGRRTEWLQLTLAGQQR